MANGATTEGCVTATPRPSATTAPAGVRALELGDCGRRCLHRNLMKDLVISRRSRLRRSPAILCPASPALGGHRPRRGMVAIE